MNLKIDVSFCLEVPFIEQQNQASFSSAWKNFSKRPLFAVFDND